MQKNQQKILFILFLFLIIILNGCAIHITKKESFKPCNKYLKNGVCLHHLNKNFNSGINELIKGQSEISIKHLKSINRYNIENENFHEKVNYALALGYAKTKKFEQAYQTLQLTNKNDFNFYHYTSGIIQLHLKNFKSSEDEFQNQLISYPGNSHKSYYALGYSQHKQNKYNEALNNYFISIKHKSFSESYIGIAGIYLKQNNPKASFKILKRANRKHRNNERIKNYKLSLSYLPEFIDNNYRLKHSRTSDLIKANYLFHKGNYKDALIYYNKVKTKDRSEYANALAGIGNVYLAMGEIQKAEKYFKQSLEKDSLCNTAIQGMGLITYHNYDDNTSRMYFKKMLSEFNDYTISYDSRVAIGNLFANSNELNNAKYHFLKALQLKKKKDIALSGLAYCITKQNGFIYSEELIDSAFTYLKLALKISHDNPNYLFRIGILYFLKKDYKNSEQYLNKAIESGFNYAEVHNAIAFTFTYINEYDKAKKHINKAIELNPFDYNYYINAGVIYSNYLGQLTQDGFTDSSDIALTKIKEYYNKAIFLGADSIICNINYAYAYVMSKNYDKAIEIYTKIHTNDSVKNSARINNIGVVYSLKNKYDNAYQYYNMANHYDQLNLFLTTINLNLKKTERAEQNINSLKKMKYTSILFYTLPFNLENRNFSNSFAYPINEIKNLPPDLIIESSHLNEHCSSIHKINYAITVSKRFKGVAKKSFTFCSGK